jgi:type IV pilus assembly protein PilO
MTNLQAGAETAGIQRVFTRERVLIGAPVLMGGVVALGMLGLAAWPAWQKLQQSEQQWESLKAQAETLPLLRRQLEQTEQAQAKAQLTQARIMGLIAGSGDISTFMAQLGEEAIRSGVELDSYEPVSVAVPAAAAKPTTPPPAAASKGTPPPPAAPADPLLAPGLRKTSVLISAQASTPRLLDFLRRMERLSLLVVQSDLSLKRPPTAPSKPGVPPPARSTDLKLNLTLFSKDGNVPTPTAPPAKP